MKLNISGLLNYMREARERLGLSQERVAEALGISKATLSEMESGHIAMSFERWLNWCVMVKKSPTDVLKDWERGNEFNRISQVQRNGYYKIIDNMIKYGYGLEVDTIMTIFQRTVDRDKEKRRIGKSKKEIKRYFPNLNT